MLFGFARALPVVSGGSRVGDLTESCKDMVAGKTLQELKQETEATAEMEVRDFLDLEVEFAGGRIIPIGRNLLTVLTELASSKQRGGDGAARNSAGKGIVPKMVAGLIRERGAHAVVWHPTRKRYQFASDFHASAAIELLRSQSPNIWAWLRRVFPTRLTFQESSSGTRPAPQLESKQSGFLTGSSLKSLLNSQGFL